MVKASARVTLRDVAACAGVHVSTVSRLLRNDPSLSVSAATRKRVEEAARELGYSPNLAARTLRTARGHLLALVVPRLQNPLVAQAAAAAQRRAEAAGFLLVISEVDPAGDVGATLRRYRQSGVAGAIVLGSVLASTEESVLGELGDGWPIVVLREIRPSIPASVAWDDEAAVRVAVGHLRSLGHESIGLITGPSPHRHAQRRHEAFLEVVRKAGADVHLVEGYSSTEAASAFEACRELLVDASHVTGIIGEHFMLGVGVLKCLRDRSIDVPRQVSVVGLYDSEIVDFTVPPLTTVDLHPEMWGERAMELLVEILDGAEPRHVLLDSPSPRLTVRQSTGVVPKTTVKRR